MVLELECVTDIGMNSVLAEFHRELLARYNLFFIDTSYGTDYASYQETAEHLQKYMNENLKCSGTFLPILTKDLLSLEVTNVSVSGFSVASDEDGAVLRRQAVDVMKDEFLIGYLNKVKDWFEVVREYELNENVTDIQKKVVQQEIIEWEETLGGPLASEKGILKKALDIIKTPTNGFLYLVMDVGKLSKQEIAVEEYLSARRLNQGTGMRENMPYEDTFVNELLFHEYILKQVGRYQAEKEGSLLKYQAEYILVGRNSDVANLKEIAERLFLLREAANIFHIISSEEKMESTKIVSAAIANLLTQPEIEPVIQTLLVLAWAGLESVRDVKLLFQGDRVPLIKVEGEWFYGIHSIESYIEYENLDGKVEDAGLTYADYLRVFLCFETSKNKTYRLMDIMEMDIRQTKGNASFRMDACIDSLEANILVKSGYGYSFELKRSYGYD